MRLRFSVVAVMLAFSAPSLSQGEPDTTIYNCDAEETILFIEKNAYPFFAPTAVPTTSEMKQAYIEAKQAQGGEACLSVLTDGTFSDQWKSLAEAIRNTDFSLPSFDPSLGALYEIMKVAVEQQLKNALDQLGEDICEFMSKDNLERLALKALARETGIRARQLSIEAFAGEITDLVYDELDDDMQRLMSRDKMKRDVSEATKKS